MRIAFALFLSLLCYSGIAWSAETTVSSVAAAPAERLFFATDREPRPGKETLDFAGQANEPVDRLTYGAIDLAQANDDKTVVSIEASRPSERTYLDFEELAQDLHCSVDRNARGDLVIFVHGCCISFREAVRESRQLCQQVKAPVVFYDWGSPFASYSGSLLACPRSQERFNSFLLAVAREFPQERITIVGLSMGNILIDNFLLQHRAEEIGKIFEQVVFARADLDSIAFRSHIARIANRARKMFIYIDSQDPVINLSHFLRLLASPVLHGDRVGRSMERLPADLPVQVVDVSPLQLAHDLPCTVIADMLSGDSGDRNGGLYKYVELPNGLLQVRPR